MNPEEATELGSAVAQFCYMAWGGIDFGVTANVLSRRMACPKKGDEVAVKKAIRHLHGHTGVQDALQVARHDRYFLPCPTQVGRETKKLDMARGSIVKWRDHVLSCSCRQQKTIAESSGGPEFSAQLLGISDALGVRHLLGEMGLRVVKGRQCGSRAARGVWKLVGVGEVRHPDLKHLGFKILDS